MGQHKITACIFLSLICTGTIIPAILAAPPHQSQMEARKFVSKPNSPKKVYHKQSISHSSNSVDQPEQTPANSKVGESSNNPMEMMAGPNGAGNLAWALAGPMMQLVRMFFGVPSEMPNGNSLTTGSDKMDGPNPGQGFSWGQVIGYGLKLLFAAMGGGSNNVHDGIDKVDTGVNANPMQGLMKTLIGTLVGNEDAGSADNMAKQTGELINLVIALMNALKTSFSQRSMRARSLGEKDRLTDISLAAIDMGKAYAKTFNTTNEACREQHICQAARECVKDVGQPNAYGLCHFTAFATANLMYYTQPTKSDRTKLYMEAARRGRSHEDCKAVYVCNETH